VIFLQSWPTAWTRQLNGFAQLNDGRTNCTGRDFYNKGNFGLTRQQSSTKNSTLTLSLTAQKANQNLDRSEKIHLGGANGVRAFPSNEGGGGDGQMLVAEMMERSSDDRQIAYFYD